MITENEKLVAEFLTWFRAGHSTASAPTYKYSLYPLKHWLEERRERREPYLISELIFDDILAYVKNIQTIALKDNTRAIYICALKAFYRYLHRVGKCKFDPELIPAVSIDTSKSSRNAATEEEVISILGTFDEFFPEDLRNKTAISLLWDSGLRLGELLSLNIDSVNTVTMSGRVKTYKRKDHVRTFRWDYTTNELIKSWLYVREMIMRRDGERGDALFISLATNGSCARMHRHILQKQMREACARLSFTRVISPHSLRHGCLTNLLHDGLNIRQVQEIAGHAKVTTTQIYTHIDDKDLERAYREVQKVRRAVKLETVHY